MVSWNCDVGGYWGTYITGHDLWLLFFSQSSFPIVRQSSVANGKVEAVAKPLPKLLTLELFNPETDDKDSDSSCVSSPGKYFSII